MTLELLLFTIRPALAQPSLAGGVVVDWERVGKTERQLGADTVVSRDLPADLERMRAAVVARLICPLDRVVRWTLEQLELAVRLGADEVLLPMVRASPTSCSSVTISQKFSLTAKRSSPRASPDRPLSTSAVTSRRNDAPSSATSSASKSLIAVDRHLAHRDREPVASDGPYLPVYYQRVLISRTPLSDRRYEPKRSRKLLKGRSMDALAWPRGHARPALSLSEAFFGYDGTAWIEGNPSWYPALTQLVTTPREETTILALVSERLA